jgi:hypothetical protein
MPAQRLPRPFELAGVSTKAVSSDAVHSPPPPVAPDRPDEVVHGFRSVLIWAVVLLWCVAVPSAWVWGGYFGLPLTELLSFRADDGWCQTGVSSVGVHCFGDFTFPNMLITQAQPWTAWDNQWKVPHPYTGTAMWPNSLFLRLQSVLGLSDLQLTASYLLLAVAALITPAVWLVARGRQSPWWIFALGLGSWPALVALDRGISAVFLVPTVLLFLISASRQRWGIAGAACVAAFCIRPQMAVLALVILVARRWTVLAWTALACAVSLPLGLLLYPGGFQRNLGDLVSNIASYGQYAVLDKPAPINLSLARSLVASVQVAQEVGAVTAPVADALVTWLSGHSSQLGMGFLIMTALALALRGPEAPRCVVLILVIVLPMVVPGVSWSYYSVLVLPLAAVLLADDPALRREVWGRGSPSRPLAVLLALTIALTVVPFVLPVGESRAIPLAQSLVGPAWMLVCMGALIEVLRSPRRGAGFSVLPESIPDPGVVSAGVATPAESRRGGVV